MKKLLKDQILELHAQGLDNEAIAIQAATSSGYVQFVINEVKKKQIFEEIKNRDQEAAEDFLKVPLVQKMYNFVLLTNDPEVTKALKAMRENKNTDIDMSGNKKRLLHSWVTDPDGAHKTDKKCIICGVLRSADDKMKDIFFVQGEWIKQNPSCIANVKNV